MKSTADEPDRHHGEGLMCEDLTTFEQLLQEESFLVRKTTAKKGKKLDTMCRIVDSDDWDKSASSRTRTLELSPSPHHLGRLGSNNFLQDKWV